MVGVQCLATLVSRVARFTCARVCLCIAVLAVLEGCGHMAVLAACGLASNLTMAYGCLGM